MFYKVYEQRVAAPPEEVWEFFSSARGLVELTPPGRKLRLVGGDYKVQEGALQIVRLYAFGVVPYTWHARISQVTPPYGFTDQAEKSLFKFWRHRHDIIPDGQGTLLRDMVAYRLPVGGKLGKAVNRLLVAKELDRLFEYRRSVLSAKFDEPA